MTITATLQAPVVLRSTVAGLGLRLTGSVNWLFAALALGLIVYAVGLTVAITSGAWFGRERTINARD